MGGNPVSDADLEAARLELLGRLLPAALHELANPLVALVGTVELLLADAEPGPTRTRLQLVQRTADEVAALVRSLQRLSRERLEPELEVDLGAFTRETAALAVRFSGVKGIGCEVRADEPATVLARPGVLRQALLALLLDALHAADADVDVDVEVDAGGVGVSAGGGDGRATTIAAAALGARIEPRPGGGVRLDITG